MGKIIVKLMSTPFGHDDLDLLGPKKTRKNPQRVVNGKKSALHPN